MSTLTLSLLLAASPAAPAPDLRALISRADLHYDTPAPRSEDGMPLGNGRMGTLVWTTPQSLRFQVNRNDVYGIDSSTTSFLERNSDYCGGTGFVEIDLGGEVLTPPYFEQHLSVYDGVMTVRGADVTARLLASPAADLIAVEIDDARETPQRIVVGLRFLRYVSAQPGEDFEDRVEENANVVRTLEHTATSRLHSDRDAIALTQRFEEHGYVNVSALSARVAGRRARAHLPNETEVRYVIPAARGKVRVLLSSAAGFARNDRVRAAADRATETAARREQDEIVRETSDWWHEYWSRGFVDLRSSDGTAEYVADNYHYFLYLMAASSRGAYPTKFNGMLWNTRGDARAWGGQHWFANLSCYYEALFASGRLELLDPVFAMFSGAYESYATAARQQWGSQGLFIPETTFFDGLAILPPPIAAEMRDLYLMRKPWSQRSARFHEFGAARLGYSSRWNWNEAGRWKDGRWTIEERLQSPYGPTSHILGTTAKVPYLYWRRYEFTQDVAWLREQAYPMLRGAAEFYRNFPNLKKGEDGRYHIHHINSNESVQGVRDSDEDLSAMRGIFPAAIRAAEILHEDAELRTAWREVLTHLAPLPMSDDPDVLGGAAHGPRTFARGRKPALVGRGGRPDGNSLPMWFFDLVSLETDDAALLEAGQATFSASFDSAIGPRTTVGVLSKIAVAGALLGRADSARYLVPSQMRSTSGERGGAYNDGRPLLNRLALREGHQALDAQRLGRAADALQLSLLSSQPPGPAREPILRLLPAWPKEWDASFRLLARGAFVVTASARGGKVETLDIESLAGARCRLRNPWGGTRLVLRRTGGDETLEGALVEFSTAKGERVSILPGS